MNLLRILQSCDNKHSGPACVWACVVLHGNASFNRVTQHQQSNTNIACLLFHLHQYMQDHEIPLKWVFFFYFRWITLHARTWGTGPLGLMVQTHTHTERERERRKTEFQTCNLSNPQSCENDWGAKGGGKEGKMGGQGVRKTANFQLI